MKNVFMKKITCRLLKEDGAIAVIVAITMVVLVGMAALALDVGMAYLSTGQLQKVCDATVYSAGRQLPVGVDDYGAQSTIKQEAINYANHNGYDDLTMDDVILGNVVLGMYTDIAVTASETVELNFAKVLGIDHLDITRNARAKLSPIESTTKLVPVGVDIIELEEKINNGDLTNTVLKFGAGDGESGSFGALSLDDDNNSSNDFRDFLAYGCDKLLSVGDILKDVGASVGPTKQGFQTRIDSCTHYAPHGCNLNQYDPNCPRIAKIVIYTRISDNAVKIVGYAAFLLNKQEEKDGKGYITGSFIKKSTTGTASGANLTEDNIQLMHKLMLVE